ncbi:hypothetical protein RJ639_040917 [Escallonia herrerae]|uniref:AAA+ ATPase domain-containing protein n=1 Tax=Escallonia herrerae TaxID=1293975 RepID=A0AA88WJW3_9ASTE|nr:hypothetical protein RJ639_040917 [Escallonia herrerae]
MACHCTLTSSFLASIPLLNNPKFRFISKSPHIRPTFTCNLGTFEANEESKSKRNQLNLLKLSVTLTVIAATLPKPSVAAKVSEKKRSAKKPEALTPQELKSWSQGLPVVANRIPYTEILELKREGKLKHIIKPPNVGLKERPEVVLAVLEDSRVVRIVLPSIESDKKFWESWDVLKIDGVCVNAYSPPVKKPEIPKPYLGFLSKIPVWVFSPLKPKPQSERALELKRKREELRTQRDDEFRRTREEREMMEKSMRMQKKVEDRRKRSELQKARTEESLRQARMNYRRMGLFWEGLASDSNVATALGFLFFFIFYRTVVLNYRKQQKDYEDRLKIEKADAEEKKKMRELEREMAGIEVGDAEDEEGGQGEKNPYMKMAMQFMKSGARVRRAQNRRFPQYLERDVDVKFSDVAGLGKIRLELEEIVKFFTHGEMYRRRGVKIPGGILLCGPPGVGKTLLAKAVAGEAGVNFFSISASQFVEIYVGVGASRVRALYQEARECAPSVVFIDELDAVGRERGLIKGSGGQERDATLNQVHARKKPMAEDVDYTAVASMTDGMVGAELANIIEVAAINMMRDGRTEITTDDLLQAAQMEERGMLDRKERSPEMWKQVAINEAAMAVVAVNFPDLRNIEFVTIAPRAGRDLGYVRVKMDHIKFKEGMLSRQSLLDHITVQLAPRAADELWYGESQLSTIWAETADNARSAARTFVLGGLSEKHYGLSNFWAADRINDIDTEALRILNMCYGRAKEILQENRKLMDAIVDELVQNKSLSKQDFFHLVELHGSLKRVPPTILDIRVARRAKFQDMMMNQKEAALQDSDEHSISQV